MVTYPKMTKIFELKDNDFKVVRITLLKEVKENVLRMNE